MTKARDNANGGAGLILIKPSSVVGGTDNGKGTVAFSASTSVSLNGVFNSTYDKYRVIFKASSGSASADLRFRFRVSGSDDTNTVYRWSYNYQSLESATSGFATNQNTAYWPVGYYLNGSYPCYFIIEINQPYAAVQKNVIVNTIQNEGVWMFKNLGGVFTNSTLFDGLTIYGTSGNFTGDISVYGYNK